MEVTEREKMNNEEKDHNGERENDIERGRTVNVQVPQKNATTPKKHRRTRIFEVSPGILK